MNYTIHSFGYMKVLFLRAMCSILHSGSCDTRWDSCLCLLHRKQGGMVQATKKEKILQAEKLQALEIQEKVSCQPGKACTDTKSAFLSVLNINDKVERCGDAVSFDRDSQTVVCDNSANVHMCRDKTHFVGDIQPCTMHKVATIGGHRHTPTGVGTVRWSKFDDEGVGHEFLVENVL